MYNFVDSEIINPREVVRASIFTNLPRKPSRGFREIFALNLFASPKPTSPLQFLLTRGRFYVRQPHTQILPRVPGQPPAGFVWPSSKTHYFYYVYFIDLIVINPREVLCALTSCANPPAGFVWPFSTTHYFYYAYFIDLIVINPREVLYAPTSCVNPPAGSVSTSRGFRMTFSQNAFFLFYIFRRFGYF